MKYVKWITLFVLVALLTACGNDTYEPREINAETDVCYICNMSVTHVDYAAQAVLKNSDVVVFDDLGCLMEYIAEHGEDDIGASYIRDNNSPQWLNIKEATFVYSKDNWTPMNYGVLAFASKEEAKKHMEDSKGEELSYEDLLTFDWGVHVH